MSDADAALRLAEPSDEATIAATLALAFFDDPVFRWFIPDDRRRRERLPRLFTLLYRLESGTILTAPGGEATSFWRAPGTAATSFSDILRRAGPLLGIFGTGIGRALAMSNAIEAHFPKVPFWYVHFVGARLDAQGRGWGSAMMRQGCARASAQGLPVYLETARASNVDFYSARGFTVTAEWDVRGGPHFWSLIHEPRESP